MPNNDRRLINSAKSLVNNLDNRFEQNTHGVGALVRKNLKNINDNLSDCTGEILQKKLKTVALISGQIIGLFYKKKSDTKSFCRAKEIYLAQRKNFVGSINAGIDEYNQLSKPNRKLERIK